VCVLSSCFVLCSFRFFRWVGLSFRINRRTELRHIVFAIANDSDISLRWKASWLVFLDCTHWFGLLVVLWREIVDKVDWFCE
jgi:hypothetical protein